MKSSTTTTKNASTTPKASKSPKEVVAIVPEETKADMIRTLIAKGMTPAQIVKAVMEVYATCYFSEITRIKANLAKAVVA